MRVLVTGATGFAGPPLIDALVRAGHHVTAAVRHGRPGRPGRPGPIAAHASVAMPDLERPHAILLSEVTALVSGHDAVVHLAGLAHSSRSIPEAVYTAVNCEGARLFAEASRTAGVKRFVLVSSVRAQCGPAAGAVLDEQTTPAPADAYGRSKLAGERAVASVLAGSAAEFVILRPVLMYGAASKGNMATLMRLARSPWPLPIGGLSGRRSVLGIANFSSAVAHVLDTPGAAGGTFLVADAGTVTPGEIVAAFRAGLGRAPRVPVLPLPGGAALLRALGKSDLAARVFGDLVVSTKALEATGWHPSLSTRDGLALAIGAEPPR